ncbi:MAG: response regulator [bacterium]|nr:response regulator [bacterium]
MATILIVDDSAFQRSFLRKALTEAGYDVQEAGDGEQALAVKNTQRPDCILTDLIMPDMRGLALLEALRDQGSEIPTIVLTADIQEGVEKRCLELGAARVLHKPVKPGVLASAVAEVLATGEEGS